MTQHRFLCIDVVGFFFGDARIQFVFFFQAEDGIRDYKVTGVQTCALPILLVVGSGAVGVEFASIYQAFGSKVILIEREPRIVPLEDADVSEALRRSFQRQGMEVRVGASIQNVRVEGDQAWSEIQVNGEQARVHTERVLMAAGRRPVTDGLGLEALGIAMERGFVRVNEYMETSVAGIFAIGDIVPGPAL